MIKMFSRFLEQNGALASFVEQVNKPIDYYSRDFREHSNVGTLLMNHHPNLWIQNCFPWEESKEGEGYWSRLESKWLKVTARFE